MSRQPHSERGDKTYPYYVPDSKYTKPVSSLAHNNSYRSLNAIYSKSPNTNYNIWGPSTEMECRKGTRLSFNILLSSMHSVEYQSVAAEKATGGLRFQKEWML